MLTFHTIHSFFVHIITEYCSRYWSSIVKDMELTFYHTNKRQSEKPQRLLGGHDI